ncbi:MAG: TolC family protein [Saprospiraceae bacterium]|nr:TolC family protein [Saprospiraceae bacterium]
MLRYISLFLIFATHLSAYSQQFLHLQEAIQKAKLHHKQLQIMMLESDLAKADIQKLKSAYLPQIQLTHQYMATNDPLNAFGFKLQQAAIQTTDFAPDLLNNPEVNYHGQTKLSLQQSMFNYDQWSLKKAMQARLQTTYYQQTRAEDKIQLEIKNAYTDLQYLYAALEVSEKALLALAENERVIQNFIVQGMAKKSELLSIQLELSNIKIQVNKLHHSIENLSNYIALFIGDPLTTKYQATSILSLDTLSALEMNLSERADFKALQSVIESRTYNRKSVQHGFIPKLNVFGEFNFYDKNVIGFNQHAFLAGIQLQWNVFNGNGRSFETQKQKIEIEKAKLEMDQVFDQARLEIIKVQSDWLNSKEDLHWSQNSVLLAEENKRIITDRFKQGLEKTSDVLNAETSLMEKNLKVLENISRHNKSIHQLEFLNASVKK